MKNEVKIEAETLDKIYPVGSVYLSKTNTNPAAQLGGTWEPKGIWAGVYAWVRTA